MIIQLIAVIVLLVIAVIILCTRLWKTDKLYGELFEKNDAFLSQHDRLSDEYSRVIKDYHSECRKVAELTLQRDDYKDQLASAWNRESALEGTVRSLCDQLLEVGPVPAKPKRKPKKRVR